MCGKSIFVIAAQVMSALLLLAIFGFSCTSVQAEFFFCMFIGRVEGMPRFGTSARRRRAIAVVPQR